MTDGRLGILQLVDSGLPSGVNSFVLNLLRSIDHDRFRVGVCSFSGEGPLLGEMRQRGTEVLVLNTNGRFGPRTVWRYLRHIRRQGYPIVHANFGARLPRGVAQLAGSRTIVHVHGAPEGAIAQVQQGDSALEREFRIAYGVCCDAIVACSRQVSEMLTSICPPLASRISTIYCGTDLQLRKPSSAEQKRSSKLEAGLPGDAVVVGFVGRLIPLKGPARLVAVAKRLLTRYPPLHFLVVGDGPLRPALEKEAQSLGNRFQVLGWQATDWFPRFDILVVCSESEGLPFSVLEAMACGIPVVSTAVGGVPEAVVHSVTGLLVPPADPQALETAIESLTCDPAMRCNMGLAGRARAELMFDSRAMARRFEALYAKIAGHACK